MLYIVLTEEQARIVAEAGGPIEVRDPQNQPLASLTPFTPDDPKASARFRTNGDKVVPNAEPITAPAVNPEEGPSDVMELPWSKARSKIRAAAREYSEQTHADY